MFAGTPFERWATSEIFLQHLQSYNIIFHTLMDLPRLRALAFLLVSWSTDTWLPQERNTETTGRACFFKPLHPSSTTETRSGKHELRATLQNDSDGPACLSGPSKDTEKARSWSICETRSWQSFFMNRADQDLQFSVLVSTIIINSTFHFMNYFCQNQQFLQLKTRKP